MAGVAVEISDEGLSEAIAAIEGIAALESHGMLDEVGRLLQESTRNRIRATKTAPDGSGWTPNRAGTSTLLQSGDLAASIDYAVSGDTLTVGSGEPYARIHQMGGTIRPRNAKRLVFMAGNELVFATKVEIPARPYLGVSDEDRSDIVQMVGDMIAGALQ
jgi:phage virion morphogenesis protein